MKFYPPPPLKTLKYCLTNPKQIWHVIKQKHYFQTLYFAFDNNLISIVFRFDFDLICFDFDLTFIIYLFVSFISFIII